MSDVTRILECMQAGDSRAADELLPLVYHELRRVAAHKLSSEPPGQTLQPTALVHEAWLRIQSLEKQHWQGRKQFFSAAAEMMRRILVDKARRKRAQKHGGGQVRSYQPLDAIAANTTDGDRLIAVHEALEKLGAQDSRKADLVKLRYFVGLSVEEAADVLEISVPTAKRDWAFAKAWLYREMKASRGS